MNVPRWTGYSLEPVYPRQLSSHTLSLLAVVSASLQSCDQRPAPATGTWFNSARQRRRLPDGDYAVVPDITASSLNIGSGKRHAQDPHHLPQLAGGAALSRDVPPLSGGQPWATAAAIPRLCSPMAMRPAPAPNGTASERPGGIGWDVGVHRDRFGGNLVLRPIANVTPGHGGQRPSHQGRLLNTGGQNLDFLDGGTLNVYGLGGSVMLDYELFRRQDIDAELRYLPASASFTGTAESVSSQADTENLALPAPPRPVGLDPRWTGPSLAVLEASQNRIPGAATGLLGFNSPQLPGTWPRTRQQQVRHLLHPHPAGVQADMFSNSTSGCSIGLAMSF